MGLDTTLHQSVLPSIFGHCPDVVGKSADERCQRQNPEDDTKGHGDFLFQFGRAVLEMEVDEDGDGDNGEIDAQPQP